LAKATVAARAAGRQGGIQTSGADDRSHHQIDRPRGRIADLLGAGCASIRYRQRGLERAIGWIATTAILAPTRRAIVARASTSRFAVNASTSYCPGFSSNQAAACWCRPSR